MFTYRREHLCWDRQRGSCRRTGCGAMRGGSSAAEVAGMAGQVSQGHESASDDAAAVMQCRQRWSQHFAHVLFARSSVTEAWCNASARALHHRLS